MSPDHVPLGPINAVAAIVETDARLIDLLDGLSLQDWEVPTIVPRWRVRHVAGHLLDTALRRLADRTRWLCRRAPGVGHGRGPAGLRQSGERRGRGRLRTAQPARARGPHAGGDRCAARALPAARSDGPGGVRRELGRRQPVAELVRHRPRAHRTLAPPAADPPGARPARDPDAGALLSGARLFHAGAAARLPARPGPAGHRRRSRSGRRRRWRLAPLSRARSLDARGRGARPSGRPRHHSRRDRLAALHQGDRRRRGRAAARDLGDRALATPVLAATAIVG